MWPGHPGDSSGLGVPATSCRPLARLRSLLERLKPPSLTRHPGPAIPSVCLSASLTRVCVCVCVCVCVFHERENLSTLKFLAPHHSTPPPVPPLGSLN